MKKRDISTRKDIQQFIDAFYAKARKDELIQHFFNEVVSIDWEHHMGKIYDFWEMTLFNANTYQGNPMEVHKNLSSKSEMKKVHFDQWLLLFKETVDEHFSGVNANLAKTRAESIATVMQIQLMQNKH